MFQFLRRMKCLTLLTVKGNKRRRTQKGYYELDTTDWNLHNVKRFEILANKSVIELEL